MSYSSELSQLEIYERTVADFYKCLNILQSIYGAIPTLSTASCSEGESANVICRFLKNLAYLLDHTKDIGTTTAVAWEAYKDFIKFYVVLNGDTEKDVKTVLNLILKLIKAYITLDERQKWHGQTILLDQCTKYAFMKIEERAKRVRRAVKTYRYSPLRSQFGNIFNGTVAATSSPMRMSDFCR
jgi:hypothetical protein